jgi:antitoxin component YwqK of YwqJK toxin-antitoxin module
MGARGVDRRTAPVVGKMARGRMEPVVSISEARNVAFRSFKEMSQTLGFWKKRFAPSLCALVASAGASALADDAISSAPGQLQVTGAVSPIAPVSAEEDDPPPPPPFQLGPPGGSTRRAPVFNVRPQPQSTAVEAEAPAPQAETFQLAPPVIDASEDEVTLPVPGPGTNLGAPSTLPAFEDVPDVRISAPIPAEAPQTEMVQERYPNGSLHIAREVTQDGQGNFINHGSWKEWSLAGELIGDGQFKRGVRDGVWRRVLTVKDSPLFQTVPYNQYTGPFVSEATLENGRLQGTWIITDAQGRKISEILFNAGVRHGTASWYHSNGRKMQQISFREGETVEEILTWRPDGSLAAKEEFLEGRKLETKTENYAQNKRKSQGGFLSPRMVVTKEDDWWNCRLATFTAEGKPDRHGAWTAWHPNGQVQVEGLFKFGKPEGEFTWYYSNGQKSAEGSYRNGERHGVWNWWHDNGLKSSSGEFADGKPAGKWTWWNPDGKVAQKADFADGVPVQALEPPKLPNRPNNQAGRQQQYRRPQ